MREERHEGAVGDTYLVEDPEYMKSRAGNVNPPVLLEKADVLMRLRHSGDCFCHYAIFRKGARLDEVWCGYTFEAPYLNNAVDALVTTPFATSEVVRELRKKSLTLVWLGKECEFVHDPELDSVWVLKDGYVAIKCVRQQWLTLMWTEEVRGEVHHLRAQEALDSLASALGYVKPQGA